MPNKKKKYRIVAGKVDYLSLCPRGANLIETTYKSDDTEGNIKLASISSDMTEKGEIYAVVYAPELRDAQGDIADAEVVKELAYSYSQSGKGIDLRHNEKVLDKKQAFIAESFIVQKSDPRFKDVKDYEGNKVDVTGGWGVVIKVDDADLRDKYRSGEWKGVSLGGIVAKTVEKQDEGIEDKTLLNKLCNAIKSILDTKKENIEENTMTKDEVKALIAECLKEQQTESSKKEAENKPTKPKVSLADGQPAPTMAAIKEMLTANVEEGTEVSEVEVAKAFQQAMKIYDMMADVDATDPRAIEAFKARKVLMEASESEAASPLWAPSMKSAQTPSVVSTSKSKSNNNDMEAMLVKKIAEITDEKTKK